MAAKDLISKGMTIGLLTTLEEPFKVGSRWMVKLQCSCGKPPYVARADYFIKGNDKSSCGCLRAKLAGEKVREQRLLTTEQFIEQSVRTHGDSYDYSKTVYTGDGEKVVIICKIHGEFEQVAGAHKSGKGCIKCAGVYQSNTQEFITKALSKWGDKYSYENSCYVKASEKLLVTCEEHGDFEVTPNNFLRGRGCPRCTKYGFKRNIKSSLYVLHTDNMVKIGVTNRPVEERISEINRSSPEKFEPYCIYNMMGVDSLSVERFVHRVFPLAYKTPASSFDGSTECYLVTNKTGVITTIEAFIEKEGIIVYE